MRNGINYSAKTFAKLTVDKVNTDLMRSAESNKAFNKEIRRVLHKANLRIQALERKGIPSPALESLGELTSKTNFAKFSTMGISWNEKKLVYGRALAFLKQPTSTISGAKEYKAYIQKTYDITDREFADLTSMLNGTGKEALAQHYENYLYKYKDYTGELEQTARQLAQVIEMEARNTVAQINNKIAQEAANITEAINNAVGEMIDNLEDLPF